MNALVMRPDLDRISVLSATIPGAIASAKCCLADWLQLQENALNELDSKLFMEVAKVLAN